MAQPPVDLAKAHRWFAVECNNQAWELVEKPSRTADEVQQMIHLAHASVLHWQSAGNALNAQRGACLLASVYVAAGDAAGAVRYAEQCLTLSMQNSQEETPFDRATALGCASRARALAGDHAQADRLRTLAQSAAAGLDDEERGVFEKLFG
jgi:ATP/maltotriose-dependent transcriptional regulator MalT